MPTPPLAKTLFLTLAFGVPEAHAKFVSSTPEHGRSLEACAGWCNSWTCSMGSCADCTTCTDLAAGRYCSSWCNSWTCGQAMCAGCTICATPPSENSCSAGPTGGYEQPPVPGVAPKLPGAHILLGMAPDYPPYTNWAGNPLELGGFNKEFADLMEPTCGVRVDMILAPWSDCWTAKPSALYFPEVTEYVGNGIFYGYVHGCTAYTHTQGERGLSLEFTDSILGTLKTAGVLTRLVDGRPVISPTLTDYTGVKLGDVTGWAPTSDTFAFNSNYCVSPATQFTKTDALLTPPADGNAAAIAALLDGTFDALYIYADQMNNFIESGDSLASGFGTTFAYIQTGLDSWSFNGTTLAISKRGSGLSQVLNPCIKKVSETEAYTKLCERYFDAADCIQNAYSTSTGATTRWYDDRMNARTDTNTCSNGYCTCTELPASS